MNNCVNCGAKIEFSPKDKGCKCQNCGSIFNINYKYDFNKKPFEEGVALKVDTLAKTLKTLKCNSCGANVLLNKNEIQVTCPYCGHASIDKDRAKNMLYIDAIIPFSFGKAEALKKFKTSLNTRIYANKKVFKLTTEKDIKGVYVNAFVFDFDTITSYNGTFSYYETVEDEDGNTTTEIKYKTVSGNFNKSFKNITIEANSNFEQQDLFSIMPYDYSSAVQFNDDFLHGYMMEYQDKMFNECVAVAEKILDNKIKQELLKYHKCDNIVNLNMNVNYPYRRYNYCLLPVYFISGNYKNKKYNIVLNGQTGKLGKLPKDWLRIALTIIFSALILALIPILVLLLK